MNFVILAISRALQSFFYLNTVASIVAPESKLAVVADEEFLIVTEIVVELEQYAVSSR
jgi:hypothetical protein